MTEPAPTATELIALDIFGLHYDIVWAPATLMPDRFGHSDAENQEIVLRAGLRGLQALDTLLHECIHAVSAATGVEITEQQTHITALGLAAIIRANPELLAWIAHRLQEEDARDYQRRTRNIKKGK